METKTKRPVYRLALLIGLSLMAVAVIVTTTQEERARRNECSPDPCAVPHCVCPTAPEAPVREAASPTSAPTPSAANKK